MSSPKISKQLSEQVILFIENTDSARLSRNLRNLLLEHLAVQKDAHSFNLDDLLLDMLNLFQLLEAAEKDAK